jgi:hypothetical protein
MRTLLFLGAAALLAAVGAASAGEPQSPDPAAPAASESCIAWPAAMVAAQASNPDASLLKVLEGTQAQQFIDVVNELPPESQFDGDHAALFFKASADQFLVVIGKNGCARNVVELPASIFAHMVGQPV